MNKNSQRLSNFQPVTDRCDDEYQMAVDLNVFEHLGINLYSNIAAVLTEVVANAWDADAENVAINVDQEEKRIEIVDDGVGMTFQDMNDKYLRVGYRRRDEDNETGKFTKKGRPVMGRKGLGKLSLFSIAEIIEVQSTKDGQYHGCRILVDGIRESLKRNQQSYQPDALSQDEITVHKGTKILLNAVKRQRLGARIKALRKRLARRFSIIGKRHNFEVIIDGQPITKNEREDLCIAQFIWSFGKLDLIPEYSSNLCESEELPNRMDDWPKDWQISGWLGTARFPKQLDSRDTGNLNSIVVFARGRLIHENILDKVNNGHLYTKYLTGQIEADFLDQDNEPDIATSDRQRMQEDDERYTQLLSFLKSSLKRVEKRWSEWRSQHEVKIAKENSPILIKWFESLPAGSKKSAEKMIANLSALPVENNDDRKTLYRHGILAFERMRIRESTEEFVAGIQDINKLLEVLADRDAMEATLYREIVKSRLNVIKDFQGIVNEDGKERVLQKYLFDHLWLLDPAWERATGSEEMESRLAKEKMIIDDLTEKEKLSRVDIAYRTYAGTHIIVELKRAGRKVKLLELVDQGLNYSKILKKILLNQGDKSPTIQVVFVLGKLMEEGSNDPDLVTRSMAVISPGSRIVHYDTLIKGAQNAYSEYLAKSKKFDQIEEIIEQI